MQNKIIVVLELFFLLLLVFGQSSGTIIDTYMDRHPSIRVILNFTSFLVFIDMIRRLIGYTYTRRNRLSEGYQDNFHFGINNIAKVLIGLAGFVSLFGLFGVGLMTLITSMSIVAAAISIILKEYINDFLVGTYFSFSRDFEINDYVKVCGQKGRITEIQMLKIKLLNDDDDMVLIPNSKVYGNEVINYTKRDIRVMSIDFQIDLSLVDNIETLEDELVTSLSDFQEYLDPNSYYLKIVEMKKDYLDLKFQYKLKKLDQDLQKKIRRKTVRQIFSHISSKDIGIKAV